MTARAAREMRKLRPADRIRPPCYVDRETGAAELCISTETWDAMVATGELPPATMHLRGRLPRWLWEDVREWLSGTREHATVEEDPFVAAARNGQETQRRGRN